MALIPASFGRTSPVSKHLLPGAVQPTGTAEPEAGRSADGALCPDPWTDGSHGVHSLSGRATPVTRRLTLVKPLSGSSSRGGTGTELRDTASRPAPAGPGWSDREAGMATAEYAIATLAAVAFAGLLAVVLGSDEVRSMLVSLIRSALTLG
ncbi:DUF4244 domain-containing protein [Arthrobacter zhaoxinii]|uniref:DUF4244 domain-containing protein n=1 Tax=Arthrobacter zhaoxinii TaxID=2964616 RepID=UPI00210587BD|nr:DUF4244 domain-containing protein [Arthrobacter zhaoxinii]MCQ1999669.1 DUF4244 domain-containing protein [Arthrobacter zhaoxinii]